MADVVIDDDNGKTHGDGLMVAKVGSLRANAGSNFSTVSGAVFLRVCRPAAADGIAGDKAFGLFGFDPPPTAGALTPACQSAAKNFREK